MLGACHRRIERQLATLARLQRHLPEHGCDADASHAARGILRYFDTAAVHHHADEEESVFPRLLVLAPAAVAAPVARLLDDHHGLAAHWRHLRPLLAAIAAGARANLPPAQVEATTAAYREHIAFEDGELIPLAGELLSAEALAEIGREMAARRGLAGTPGAL
jgi:hemerythrin-like domain-containing protein